VDFIDFTDFTDFTDFKASLFSAIIKATTMSTPPLEISQKKLAITGAIAGLFVLVFGVLTHFSPATNALDAKVEWFFAGARTPLWNSFFLVITYLGSVEFISMASVVLALIFLIRKKFAEFCIFLGVILANTASIVIIKDFVERTRPITAFYSETSFSFPSGHTAISVLFYGMLAYLIATNLRDVRARTNILFAWIFFMIMIGFSRMYLGVHFLTDVISGYAVGLFWLSVGILSFELLMEQRPPMWKKVLHLFKKK